ncbi:MAG: hypothetical protein KDA87_04115 [Planctomycetales bacterium]|nr:hypothetical protein [Planctomycetales bacterium]
MSDRERWIVYPLLFFSLIQGLRASYRSDFPEIECHQLLVKSVDGQKRIAISGHDPTAGRISIFADDTRFAVVELGVTSDDTTVGKLEVREKNGQSVVLAAPLPVAPTAETDGTKPSDGTSTDQAESADDAKEPQAHAEIESQADVEQDAAEQNSIENNSTEEEQRTDGNGTDGNDAEDNVSQDKAVSESKLPHRRRVLVGGAITSLAVNAFSIQH